MKEIGKDIRILVCVGTGGVGKTSLAAALGALAAESGRRVLVLTIDPAQRLKTTLGLSDQGEVRDLVHPRIKGRFAAAVINSKRTFDDFVRRATLNSQAMEKILKNKLYIQLSTTLSGSQEFTALEKLYCMHESGEFDLIILDTPPAQHAMDFLNAPQKLKEIFQEKITKWFRIPLGEGGGFFSGLFQAGTRQVLKGLEILTGSEFMQELADFFVSIQGWQSKLEERVARVNRLLLEPQTQFFLVGSYDRAKLLEAKRFGQEITQSGYHLHTLILNRAFPEWLLAIKNSELPKGPATALAAKWRDYFQKRKNLLLPLTEVASAGVKILEIPELNDDIRDLDGVFRLVDWLKEAE